MKQDNLEKFITDNKNEFDVFEPGDELWEKIQDQSTPVKRMNWKLVLGRVAAVLAIFIASYFFHDMVQKPEGSELSNTDELEQPGDERMQMLMEAEVFYTSKINAAKEEIFTLAGNNREMIDIVNYDLEELDDVFTELKNDLKDNSHNEEVIEAMIQNYRLKLEILEEMLLQLNKSKNEGNKDDNYEI